MHSSFSNNLCKWRAQEMKGPNKVHFCLKMGYVALVLWLLLRRMIWTIHYGNNRTLRVCAMDSTLVLSFYKSLHTTALIHNFVNFSETKNDTEGCWNDCHYNSGNVYWVSPKVWSCLGRWVLGGLIYSTPLHVPKTKCCECRVACKSVNKPRNPLPVINW